MITYATVCDGYEPGVDAEERCLARFLSDSEIERFVPLECSEVATIRL